MTEQTLKEGQEILRKIEHIKTLKKCMCLGAIKITQDNGNYFYLCWADNENNELKNTIINWCDNEIQRLQMVFDEL